MTGYGAAQRQVGDLNVNIELRAVNNRYLKLSLRTQEPYHLLEAEIEKVTRRFVRRGTIQMSLRCKRPQTQGTYQISPEALASYVAQIREQSQHLNLIGHEDALLSQVLSLPGVVIEPESSGPQVEEDWPAIEQTLIEALENLQQMRGKEGQAMAEELLQHREVIASELAKIQSRVEVVVEEFRNRLLERVGNLLRELDVRIDRNDLIRETSIFAERSDVAEEITRLHSHLGQFRNIVEQPGSEGRKLDFLTQEMFREVNTIGSKASDVTIAEHVVEIKGTLEKIRELIQNVE